MEGSAAEGHDRLGESVKSIVWGRATVVGLVAATATIIVSWLVVFLLGLVPSQTVQGALGMKLLPGEPFSVTARLVRALFAPWNGAVTVATTKSSYRSAGVLLFPTLVGSVAIVGVGLLVRRLVAPMRSRLTALLVAALAGSAVVALCAAVLSYSVTIGGGARLERTPSVVLPQSVSGVVHFSHPGGVLFFSAFFLTFVVGAFSYGVVALLPRQVAGAARRGGLYVIIPTVLVGLLFPIAVAVRSVPDVSGGKPGFWAGSQYAAGVASATVPLAYGARATFETGSDFPTPFAAGYSTKNGADKYRWSRLQRYVTQNPSARIVGYGGVYGRVWKAVGLLLVIAMITAWAGVVVRYVSRLGAPHAADGLRLGLLAGAAGSVAVYVVAGLARFTYVNIRGGIPGWASDLYVGLLQSTWGATGSAATQAAVLMLVVGGAAGLVYAAFRPAPRRYEPLTLPIALRGGLREH